ncbi:MAG: BamA/TamA family outer membrane protein [Bacteroidales bacterium]|nr:BamA/TamA family outer membrane protein [Bacteroidales bacterium]
MNARKSTFLFLLLVALAVLGCSTTRTLQQGEFLLRSNKVVVNDKSFSSSELTSYLTQKPNSWILGTSPQLVVYNWGGNGDTGIGRLFRKLGVPPVVYDPLQVDESIDNILSHLRYIGYYGSHVESQINVKQRKVYVTYYVALGRRYSISTIDYDIPTYGTFRQDFDADISNISIKEGTILSEKTLEAEAERSAAWFRTRGYYGFNKNFYLFEADTLAGDGKARLKMSIRDYALGDTPAAAQEHRKYTIGDVTISRPSRLKIRPSVLSNLNTLRPGDLYNERDINTTYSRLSSVGMLTGVNLSTTPTEDGKVDCSIALRNSGLQGFKLNLEASVNSTALIGISPQITYYHRNIFHGGEILNLSVMANLQFRPRTDVRAVEYSATASIRFPKFIGLPNRLFKGPYIPKTDISLAYNYQDRPEFRRTTVAAAFTYNGRFGPRLFYQFSPVRANVSRLFGLSKDFAKVLLNNILLAGAYVNNFDMGISGMLYYTTDSSVIPSKPYHYIRLSFDQAGNIISLFNPLLPLNEDSGVRTIWNMPYAQYTRFELQLGKTFRFGYGDKQSLALHFLAGAGFAYGNSREGGLPYDKLFYSGGSMSMRGWQARTLGPGTDTELAAYFTIPTQVGDMKLEANIEYRFPLFWKLEGALFADAGNVWALDQGTEDSLFSWHNLGESMGLDWGLGLRVNLNFILLRIDGGFRVHDPGRAVGDRWLGPARWFTGGGYAVHFGVGYPF